MPNGYVKTGQKDFVFAYNLLKENKKYLKNAFFTVKDKIFLTACLINIKLVKKILSII